ncbi:glycerophosphoryl diester phosphodiesterase membrane domain-containing protein [Vagococcus salmoninarum]|uniref:glycerophosphoryl diester phosphodiesterase membrane domain-containing protein n=1 Tax=Vagococcus salmoninarum TaxID=2739 RepID=UPI003F977805
MRAISIIKRTFSQMKAQWLDYFGSVLVLQVIRIGIVLPVLSFLFYKMLSKANVLSITQDNFQEIITHPLAILLGIALLLLFVFFTFYELGYFFILANNKAQGNNIKVREIVRRLNSKARFFLSIHSLVLFLYFLLILPLVSFGLNAELIQNIKVPDFIIDELLMTPGGLYLYIGVLVVLSYLALRLLYAIYFFVTDESLSIWQSLKNSWHYSKGKSFQNIVILGGITLLFGLLIGAAVFIIMLPVIGADKFAPLIAPVIAGIAMTLIQIIIFLFGGLLQPLIATAIVASASNLMTEPAQKEPKKSLKKWLNDHRKLRVITSIGLIGLLVFNIWSTVAIIYQPQSLMIAHRGFMSKGVENSLGGLRASAAAGADFVELDIQETSDQQFVVMHDYNLKRLAGINQEVRKLTLAELQKIEIKQNGFVDTIPSLAEFIEVARETNIKLLIEIKPHGYESPEMVANLVDFLNEKEVETDFLVQSLDLNILNEVKELEPKIKTGYIIPLNIGSLPQSVHDFYVVEDFSITESLINEAAELDKDLFVWTVNKEELLKKYLRLDIDGIITNHPDLGIALLESQEATRTFANRVQYLLED